MALGPALKKAREDKGLTASQVAAATNMKVQIVEDLEQNDFHRIAAPIYGKGFIKLYAEHVDLDPKPLLDEYVAMVASDRPSLVPRDAPKRAKRRRTAAKRGAQPASEPSGQPAASPSSGAVGPADADLFAAAAERRRTKTIVDENVRGSDSPPTAKRVHATPRGLRVFTAYPKRAWNAACSSASECVRWVQRTGKTLGGQWAERLSNISFGDAPVKTVAAAVGVLVLLLFLVSGLSRCARRQDAPDSDFPIAMDAPEPYFE